MHAITTHPSVNKLVLGWKPLARPLALPGTQNGRIASAMQKGNPGLQPRRFTLDGSDALERHLSRVCRRIRDELRAAIPACTLKGVMLGGGYGRGEGGVLRTQRGDQPYNDLEFYVLVQDRLGFAKRKWRQSLRQLHEPLSALAGVEVEFKLLTLDALRRSAPTMFYYDLVMGHRWLIGEPSLLAGCEHHRDASRIPLHEATRLWMNRATGLLFAAERLRRPAFSAGDADFVGRNLAKAQLALGDIVLAARGEYHWSCRERNRRLHALEAAELPVSLSELCRHHDTGVEFKLHPVRSTASREALATAHQALVKLAGEVLLWLESRRLGTAFASLRDYAFRRVNKCPETAAWKNWLITTRALGARQGLQPESLRYPRGRLLTSLALLLGVSSDALDDRALSLLQRQLCTRSSDFAGLVVAHENLWRRFG